VKDMAFWTLQPKEKSVIAKPFSQLLMLYLQTFSDRLLTRCYPNVCFLPPSFTLSAAQTQILDSDFQCLSTCYLGKTYGENVCPPPSETRMRF
jgi:hypothetical protein